ncbi:phage major capsid protein [Mesorhizobium sp. BR-1-1-10]|uniref:phage major capsid protein n=1 Tax=Mesorhizobium sp. BR-1-1-10 TaxID=2876660 RepID=UPI001CD1906F|nr:phage major capsid protein [Mesorhizobium sp. BR-1-1-10]MBZ9975487.1 phage major capsid protein [Mesorhizobium sp. BR-1-1-10]
MDQLQELTKLGGDLQVGLTALQAAQEKSQKDTDGLIKGQIDKISTDIGAKLEDLQSKQAALQAAVERVGTGTGEKAEDAVSREKKEAFVAFLRAGGDANKLTVDQVKALSTDNLANGGYLVTPQMLGIVNGRVFETSPMRKVASVIKTSHKSVEVILDDDEASAGWAGENDTPSETNTPQLGKLEIVAKKLYAYPKTSNEMLADAEFDVEAWLTGKIGDRFSRLENTAFLTGDGVSKPRGLLTYGNWTTPGAYQRGAIEQIANGSTTAPAEVGLIQLMGSLKEDYQANASMMMNRATFIEYLKLSGTNVFRFFNLQPQSGPTGTVLGTSLSLLEKPVYLASDMPVIASNALAVAYGDFSRAYTVVDRQAISVLKDPYTAPGMTKFYAEKRVGGAVTNYDAIKLLRMSVS